MSAYCLVIRHWSLVIRRGSGPTRGAVLGCRLAGSVPGGGDAGAFALGRGTGPVRSADADLRTAVASVGSAAVQVVSGRSGETDVSGFGAQSCRAIQVGRPL